MTDTPETIETPLPPVEEAVELADAQTKARDEWPIRDPVEAARQGQPVMCTDLGNAERFAFRNGDKVCCTPGYGWRRWDGRRWAPADNSEIIRLAARTVRRILQEAAVVPRPQDEHDRDWAKLLTKHAYESEAKSRLEAMVSLAQAMPGISTPSNRFDADPFLLNCLNATLDLRTGVLREHDLADLITMLAPVTFDRGVLESPEWKRWLGFLHDSTGGNEELIAFLQRAVGYSLTGDTSEEKLFFIHGPENTGKTTFLEALKKALGDYAVTSNFEMLVKKQHGDGGPRNDIARLAGKRFVASSEVSEGKQLAEDVVKSVTGGETISARFLHKEFFEFEPAFKLWLAANHAPKVNSEDGAMWRRILRIPFDKVVPKEKRDPKLKKMLKDPKLGGPVVLLWALLGCLEWQRKGLGVPQVVEQATEEYRADCDPLKDFLAECCELQAELSTDSSDLRQEYDRWSSDNGIHPRYRLSPKAFADKLKAHGCTPARGSGGVRRWNGIGLTTPPPSKWTGVVTPVTDSDGISLIPPYEKSLERNRGTGATGATIRHFPSQESAGSR